MRIGFANSRISSQCFAEENLVLILALTELSPNYIPHSPQSVSATAGAAKNPWNNFFVITFYTTLLPGKQNTIKICQKKLSVEINGSQSWIRMKWKVYPFLPLLQINWLQKPFMMKYKTWKFLSSIEGNVDVVLDDSSIHWQIYTAGVF